MTQRHFNWITWSLRWPEEHVELQTGAIAVLILLQDSH